MMQYLFFTLGFFWGFSQASLALAPSDIQNPHLDLCQTPTITGETIPDGAYQGGVDADGNTVASADVGGGAVISLPRKIHIPILMNTYPLLGTFLQKNPNNQIDPTVIGDTDVSRVEYDTTTHDITVNGAPLNSDAHKCPPIDDNKKH